jgi:beta-glucosidase
MAKTITGMNNAGVVTVGRHFLMNEQETNRSSSTHYSSNADDKTIHELYLWPFADAVHAGMGAVMCAMNRVNNTLSCENDKLINGLLKTELGFPGCVLPDVNSQSTAFGSANAGLDFGSSTYWTTSVLEAGIANGSFSEARLDDMTVRNTIGYFYADLDNGKQPEVAATTEYRDVRADHAKLIRKIGADSLALLKNNNTAGAGLPLDRPRTISIFGAHAGPSMAGPNFAFSVVGTDSDVYQGHLASAVGSGGLSNSYLATPFQALSLRATQDGSMFRWIMNDTYTESSSSSSSSSFGGSSMGGMGDMAGNSTESQGGPPDAASSSANASMSANAGGASGGGGGAGVMGSGTTVSPSIANYAADSEVCLVFLNSWSGEGADRSELYNQDQDNLVNFVAENCNNTIVVINTSGPRLLDQWIENDNVTAVVYGGYLGQESGNAIVDVLYGDVNPNGKLSYTIAKNETDYPVSICNIAECNFDEKTNIDYRHFDASNVSVRYPFGHGLSYTTFEYGNVSAVKTDEAALASKYPSGVLSLGGAKDLFDDVISIHFSLKNTGDVDGAEVAQLYVQYPSRAQQPVRQLRGFEKVALSAGQQKDISISVRRRDISFWDTVAQKWALASGTYTFSVGSSSRDLRGSVQMSVL